MEKDNRLYHIANPLVQWYLKNARKLPWRADKDPYHIWISEIMLQQTKIEAVKKYYIKFMEVLPNVHALASIEEEQLLKLWEGLGYYSRARNLKKAAMIIEEKYQGKMPTSYESLLSLPGIGEYTAGAIASIAYNEKVPAVDGNVLRVISRIIENREDVLLPNTKKKLTKEIIDILPAQSGAFNEGIMELGELICIPNGMPLCEQCPIKEYCLAKEHDTMLEIPLREKKTVRKQVDMTVFLLTCGEYIAIQKREEKGLLSGMYEFPNIQSHLNKKEREEHLTAWNMTSHNMKKVGTHHHVFTHIEWDMIAYQCEVSQKTEHFIWCKPEELEELYPIPTAFHAFKKKWNTKNIKG